MLGLPGGRVKVSGEVHCLAAQRHLWPWLESLAWGLLCSLAWMLESGARAWPPPPSPPSLGEARPCPTLPVRGRCRVPGRTRPEFGRADGSVARRPRPRSVSRPGSHEARPGWQECAAPLAPLGAWSRSDRYFIALLEGERPSQRPRGPAWEERARKARGGAAEGAGGAATSACPHPPASRGLPGSWPLDPGARREPRASSAPLHSWSQGRLDGRRMRPEFGAHWLPRGRCPGRRSAPSPGTRARKRRGARVTRGRSRSAKGDKLQPTPPALLEREAEDRTLCGERFGMGRWASPQGRPITLGRPLRSRSFKVR